MATNSCIGMLMDESDNPGFFKVLRKEDLSSPTMRGIPQDFLKSISAKEFSFKMVLKLPWGSSWQIKLSKYQSFYYMEKNGWDQFLSDNGLGADELLTFTHKGNMCFNVSIYQINCLEMLRPNRSATIASSSSRNKREEVSNGKEEERESLSASNYPVSETAESTVGGRLKQKRQLINLGKKQVKKAEKANKCKKRKMDTDSDDDSEAGTSSLVPEFTLTIKKSYVLFLGVPKRFAEMHMPKEERVFKIHDRKGKKSWEVTYVVSKIQSRFSRGWPRLVKDFGLEIGDFCTFELIKPTEMILTVSK